MISQKAVFLQYLDEAYAAENAVLSTLEQMANEATDPEIRQGLLNQRADTQLQIGRLRSIIERYGGDVSHIRATSASLLAKARDLLRDRNLTTEEKQLRNLTDTIKTKRLEQITYAILIELAKAIGDEDAMRLLSESLEEEKRTADSAEAGLPAAVNRVFGAAGPSEAAS